MTLKFNRIQEVVETDVCVQNFIEACAAVPELSTVH